MCGIAGYVGDGDRGLLKRMCDAMAHRGPDDEGYWLGEGVGLGHRRLSIIDLSGGAQPMSNEDGSIWVVFNGEIYNFQELRRDLESRGHIFRTKSDTEAIVHAYEEYGCDCLERLRGCFAFAIWDAAKQQLFMARDRFGQKPLYYHATVDRISFASELTALATDRHVPRTVDDTALAEYLRFGYVPSPYSIYSDVWKLRPGQFLVWRQGRGIERLERYWRPEFLPKDELTEEEAAEQLLHHLRESVRLRLISDVPVGVLLSGGIDSSIMVALAAEMSEKPVQTFTMGFEEEGYDERSYARQVADIFGTDHHEFVAKPDITDLLPTLAQHYGEPYADDSAVPTYCLAQGAAEHVKVALVGDGGDELFAGYLRLPRMIGQPTPTESWRSHVRRPLERLPLALRRAIAIAGRLGGASNGDRHGEPEVAHGLRYLGLSLPERYRAYMDLAATGSHRSVFAEDFRRDILDRPSPTWERLLLLLDNQELAPLDRLLATEMEVPLPDDLCVKMDIASMAHGLEARSPLLDHELAEFANSLPPDVRLRNGTTKYLLKQVFRKVLPERLLGRTKHGFVPPRGKWLSDDLADWARGALQSRDGHVQRFCDTAQLAKVVDQHIAGSADHGQLLWRLLMLETWLDSTRSL